MKYVIIGRGKANPTQLVFYSRIEKLGGYFSQNWDGAQRFGTGDLAQQEFDVHRNYWNWTVWDFMILPEDAVQSLLVGRKFAELADETGFTQPD